MLSKAPGPVRLITSQFIAKCNNREDQRISQTRRTATHDAPWSFLLHHAFPLTSLFLHKIPCHPQLSVSLDKLTMYFHISADKARLFLMVIN